MTNFGKKLLFLTFLRIAKFEALFLQCLTRYKELLHNEGRPFVAMNLSQHQFLSVNFRGVPYLYTLRNLQDGSRFHENRMRLTFLKERII